MPGFYIGDSALATQVQALTTRITDAEAANAAASGRLDTVETWKADRVKYLYPNGGTEAVPATITTSARYVLPSPYPEGVLYTCVTEMQDENGEWFEYKNGIYSSGNGGFGAISSKHGDTVVLKTGSFGVGTWPYDDCNAKITQTSYTAYTSLKIRIKCVRED